MKDKLLRFARGNFSDAKANIHLSEKAINLKTEEGRDYHGSFLIGNEAGISMKGILYSECSYIKFESEQFTGTEVCVKYVFSPGKLTAGEKVSGEICIISSCGEVIIPLNAEIVVPVVETNESRISNLNQFAEYASKHPGEAIDVFCSEQLVPVFLYRDINRQILYDTLIKGPQPAQAMEEFLINTKKKNRVVISVDRNYISYNDCVHDIADSILISRNTWGYQEIFISSDVEYIIPEFRHMNTERFEGDSQKLAFRIDASLLRSGTNTGHIFLDTINRHIEITILCEVYSDEDTAAGRSRYVGASFLRAYMNYIMQKSDKETFISSVDTIIVAARRYDMELEAALLGAIKSIVNDSGINNCMDVIEELEPYTDLKSNASAYEVFLYAAACYIDFLAYSYTGNACKAKEMSERILSVYEKGYNDPAILYLLLNSYERYKNEKYAVIEMYTLLKNGETSPLIYYEYCNALKKHPDYMHEWDDIMVRPLAWGIKNGIFDMEMALTYTYHAGKLKYPGRIVLKSLERLYDDYGLEDTLRVICSILIRRSVVSERALAWYELGIEKKLRITQIYEYFMQSLPDNDERVLPNQVVTYFMYDNQLGDREKAILYASVIRSKESNPAVYDAYYDLIKEFAKKELAKGSMNKNYVVIYTDCIRKDEIAEEVSRLLPRVLFSNELVCSNPHMKEVCVVTDELACESITRLVDGRAMIDVCSDSQKIYLIDENGSRYLDNNYYILNRMLRFDGYAEKCFEYNKEDVNLLVYMYISSIKDYHIDKDIITIRRYAKKTLKLRDYYDKLNMTALINYYYEHAEGEYLDEILSDSGVSDRTEMYIIRGMYDKALEDIRIYGFDNVSTARLNRFCNDMIEDIGIQTENDIIVKASYKIFKEGSYSDNILRYLVQHYTGPLDNMINLWKTSKGFDIGTKELTERILVQAVFTESTKKEINEVFKSYFEYEWLRQVARAYACHRAYSYLTDDCEIDDFLWFFIRDNMIKEQNVCCELAVLKRLSSEERLNIQERDYCDVKLSEMTGKGIIFDFYKKFEGKVDIPAGISDREFMQCIKRPGMDVKVSYETDGKIRSAKANEVYYGVYVKEIAVFADESINYEFYEEKGNSRVVLKKGTITYTESKETDITRFRMLNDMIACRSEGDIDGLYDRMECYIRLDEASKQLFKIL